MENFQKEQNQNSEINVIFYNPENQIIINCSLKDKCSDIIQKYKNLAQVKSDTLKFIFNAQALYQNLTVEEAGMTHNANVFVVETNGVRGG